MSYFTATRLSLDPFGESLHQGIPRVLGENTGYFGRMQRDTKYVHIGGGPRFTCSTVHISLNRLTVSVILDQSPKPPVYASHHDHVPGAQHIKPSTIPLLRQPTHFTTSPSCSTRRQRLRTHLFIWAGVQTICYSWLDRACAASQHDIFESAHPSYNQFDLRNSVILTVIMSVIETTGRCEMWVRDGRTVKKGWRELEDPLSVG
jgi:hypothetical protein